MLNNNYNDAAVKIVLFSGFLDQVPVIEDMKEKEEIASCRQESKEVAKCRPLLGLEN
jgi:hypothetical protein